MIYDLKRSVDHLKDDCLIRGYIHPDDLVFLVPPQYYYFFGATSVLLDSREQQQARKPCQRFGHTGEPAKQRRRKEEKEEKKEIGMKTEAILGRCLASIVFHPHFSSN